MDHVSSRLLPLLVSLALSGPVLADSPGRLSDRDAFVALVAGRELTLPMFAVSLKLDPSGGIDGSALGWPVTGKWRWEDGLFCRSMDWSGTEIPKHCQMVEQVSEDRLRFTSDAGEGMSAVFRLN